MSESIPFFGRQDELAMLRERVTHPGLTILAGPPRIGKSRLIAQLSEALVPLRKPNVPGMPALYTGYVQATAQENDPILRALADLYVKWLKDSSFWQQGRVLKKEWEENIIARLGKSTFDIIGAAFKGMSDPLSKGIGETVQTVSNALWNANERLRDGGISLATLTIDKTEDILTIPHDISGASSLLILDALDQLPSDAVERVFGMVLECLRRESLPPTHFLLTVRNNKPFHKAWSAAQNLIEEYTAGKIVEVGEIDFTQNVPVRDEMLTWVHTAIPVTKQVADDALLKMVNGHPGVLKDWLLQKNSIRDAIELRASALNSYTLRYNELTEAFTGLMRNFGRGNGDKELPLLCARLALFPEIVHDDVWDIQCPIVLAGMPEDAFMRLQTSGILDNEKSYASFGHTTRYEVAHAWWLKDGNKQRAIAREAMEHMIFRNAEKVESAEEKFFLYILALFLLEKRTILLTVCKPAQALCYCAHTLIQNVPLDFEKYKMLLPYFLDAAKIEPHLVTMGLFNVINHYASKKYPTVCDKILEELRNITELPSSDAFIRDQFVKGLSNTLATYAKENSLIQSNQLLEELRMFAGKYPNESSVSETLSTSLCNMLDAYARMNHPDKRDKLLQELRVLTKGHSDNSAIRKQLAIGLFNTLNAYTRENRLSDRDRLLQEFRDLTDQHPTDTAVRERLAKSIVNVLHDHTEKKHVLERNDLLQELRSLTKQYPGDVAVRELLAMALLHMFLAYGTENQVKQRIETFKELEKLAQTYPDDIAVRQRIAKGLVNMLAPYAPENHPLNCDAILQGLDALAKRSPNDSVIQEQLARGLVNLLRTYAVGIKPDECKKPLQELRLLAEQYPKIIAIRIQLANGLFNTVVAYNAANYRSECDALLQELRAMLKKYSNDTELEPIRTRLLKQFPEG